MIKFFFLFLFAAAHCFKNKGEMRIKSQISVYAGKHDLSIFNELGSSEHLIRQIVLHPDWDSFSNKFDADIAIVVLRTPVKYSITIQPICLPPPSSDEVIGIGTIIGWGKSEPNNEVDFRPNELEVLAVNQSQCFFTHNELVQFSSHRTFCAGFVNQSKAPCTGDSGSGVYFRDPSTELFQLQGIVSASLFDPDRGCDIEAYSIYTNIARFVDWIRKKVD